MPSIFTLEDWTFIRREWLDIYPLHLGKSQINYLIRDAETGKRLSKAYTVQVAVLIDSGEMLFASPRVFLDKLSL